MKSPAPWANRGIVIRSWKARLGGKDAAPWIAERGLTLHRTDSSTLDLVPPPGVTRLEPGDFVEATIEHIVMPQFARDYYGPNAALRAALEKDENTWRMIHREAIGNDRRVEMKTGALIQTHPAITIAAVNDEAEVHAHRRPRLCADHLHRPHLAARPHPLPRRPAAGPKHPRQRFLADRL